MADVKPIRLSTRDLPHRDRAAIWREVVGRSVLRLDIEPLPSAAVEADLTLHIFPGLVFAQAEMWGARERRTRELLSDGNDTLGFVVNISGSMLASNADREVTLGDGDAVLMSSAEVGTFTRATPGKSFGFAISRSELAPRVADVDDAVLRPVARDSEALRLLIGYVGLLRNGPALGSPELRRLAAVHVCDLAALVIGATRDAAAVAEARGARAARLRAIKVDVIANIGRGDLAIETVSRRHRLTVRYIQRLFEHDGTTFSQFAMSQRLARAHYMLTDSAAAASSIGDIAAACGFSDHTHFNRRFRRAYGAAPSDVRAASRQQAPR